MENYITHNLAFTGVRCSDFRVHVPSACQLDLAVRLKHERKRNSLKGESARGHCKRLEAA